MTGKRTHLGNQSWIKEASPDDPIYKRGFVIAGQRSPGLSRKARRKRDAELKADLDGWLGDEFKNGLEAQERGEDPTPKRDSDDQ